MENTSNVHMNKETKIFALHHEDELKHVVEDLISLSNADIREAIEARVQVIIGDMLGDLPEEFHARSILADELENVQAEEIALLASMYADEIRPSLRKN